MKLHSSVIAEETKSDLHHNNGLTYGALSTVLSWQWLLMSVFIMISAITVSAQAATVSVSNYPLFLLSEAVTEGTPSAKQLLQAGEIGHHGGISPLDKKDIQDSMFVVWFGESLENSLTASLEDAPNAIALLDFDAFKRYPQRDEQAKPISNTLDPHIWFDAENAKAITRALAVIHSHANPQHKAIYQANVQKFAQRMDAAVASAKSKSAKPEPYWAYHDAFQYIENSLNLQLVGTLTRDHHLAPKASQLRWLNQQRPNATMCLVAQSVPAKGLLSKLQPVRSTVQAEDMSNSKDKDFVEEWQQMAEQMRRCIA